MALRVRSPSKDPRDPQAPGRSQAGAPDERDEDPPARVRLVLRLAAVTCYVGGLVAAMSTDGVARWLLWAVAVVPWGAVLVLGRIRPAWAVQRLDRESARSED